MNHDDSDKSAREQEWPDALDAMIAAPEHHEVRCSTRYTVIRVGATCSAVPACANKTLPSDHSDPRTSALLCG